MFQLQGFVSPELSHPTFPLAGPDRPDVASFSSELVPGAARLPPRGLLQTPPFYQLLTFRCQVKQDLPFLLHPLHLVSAFRAAWTVEVRYPAPVLSKALLRHTQTSPLTCRPPS